MRSLHLMYDALIGARVPPEKALAVVQAFEAELPDRLATKDALAQSEKLLASRLDAAEAKLGGQIELLGTSLKAEIGAVNTALQNAVTALMARDDSYSLRATIKLGAMLTTVAALALAIAKILFG
jgi:hypothetical protein